MSHRLIDLNDDLRRLREEGYNVDIDSGHLIVRDIPYVTSAREIRRGALATSLDLNGDHTIRPSDHTIKFAGEYPCTSAGEQIAGIRHGSGDFKISDRVTTQHSFSSKPTRGHYENYYEKIRTYVAILSGPAALIDDGVTARTYQVVEPHDEDTPFAYIDTASARAEINMATKKLSVEKVAIIGLGGTGSYVLDLLAKTPVQQIHLFDGDKFSSHNAFRAPGAASKDDLHNQPLKVDYFKEIYSRMHLGIVSHGEDIDATNVEQLRGMTNVFLCLDRGAAKKLIVEKLEEYGLSYIDVGMGLYVKNDTIGGILRVTASDSENRATARARISFAESDGIDEYDKNIQIADLNALNAALAVIRWKKMRAFYFDLKHERYSSYTIGGNMLLSEDIYEPH
jgi:molybdopterin/thiamine biosynthesis adenylyltransferase